jgi:hypothetical protein
MRGQGILKVRVRRRSLIAQAADPFFSSDVLSRNGVNILLEALLGDCRNQSTEALVMRGVVAGAK